MENLTLSPETKEFLVSQLTEQKAAFEAQIATAKYDDAHVKSAIDAERSRIDGILAMLNKPGAGGSGAEEKSVADQFIESEQFKAYIQRGHHQGGTAMAFKELPFQTKTTIDTAAVGNATYGILNAQRIPGIQWGGTRRTRVWDLIPRIPTSNNAVDFVKENTFTNNAYPQTEASAKAESALTFVIGSAPVRTFAHWIPATDQILADFPGLRAAIDFRLMSGLADEVDFQLLRGDGTGVNITGLFTAATAYSSSYNTSGDTYIDKLGAAMEQLEDSNRMATGIVLRPSDWRKINRIKTDAGGANTGEYLLGGPAALGNMTLWNTPVATSNAVPPGKFLVADFANGCAIYDRMDARIDISNQHSDFFTKNMVAIRAEMRLALAILRTDCLIYGSLY